MKLFQHKAEQIVKVVNVLNLSFTNHLPLEAFSLEPFGVSL